MERMLGQVQILRRWMLRRQWAAREFQLEIREESESAYKHNRTQPLTGTSVLLQRLLQQLADLRQMWADFADKHGAFFLCTVAEANGPVGSIWRVNDPNQPPNTLSHLTASMPPGWSNSRDLSAPFARRTRL